MSRNGPAAAAAFLTFSIILSSGFTYAEILLVGENTQTVFYDRIDDNGGSGVRLPLNPETQQNDDGMPHETLELRVNRRACRGVAQLSQIAQKCQTINSAPLNG